MVVLFVTEKEAYKNHSFALQYPHEDSYEAKRFTPWAEGCLGTCLPLETKRGKPRKPKNVCIKFAQFCFAYSTTSLNIRGNH